MGFQLPSPQTGEFVYRISKVGPGWFAVLIGWCLVLDTPKTSHLKHQIQTSQVTVRLPKDTGSEGKRQVCHMGRPPK